MNNPLAPVSLFKLALSNQHRISTTKTNKTNWQVECKTKYVPCPFLSPRVTWDYVCFMLHILQQPKQNAFFSLHVSVRIHCRLQCASACRAAQECPQTLGVGCLPVFLVSPSLWVFTFLCLVPCNLCLICPVLSFPCSVS